MDYNIPLDPTATADSKNVVSRKILQWHGDGTPEEYIVWCQAMQELYTHQGSIIMSALGGTAKKSFSTRWATRNVDDVVLDFLGGCVKELGKNLFRDHAYRTQRRYLRYEFWKTRSVSVRQFVDRLAVINSYLGYFPEGVPMVDDKLHEILVRTSPAVWKEKAKDVTSVCFPCPMRN